MRPCGVHISIGVTRYCPARSISIAPHPRPEPRPHPAHHRRVDRLTWSVAESALSPELSETHQGFPGLLPSGG
eukprot:6417607-Alexandrium_andersonii.AAC.1